MSVRKCVWVSWKCAICGRSHKDSLSGMAQGNMTYWLSWRCDKCKKYNRIELSFMTGIDPDKHTIR
jgi:hypothetical protein